jgi:hypothetical protein
MLKPDCKGGFFIAEMNELLESNYWWLIAENLGIMRMLPTLSYRDRLS